MGVEGRGRLVPVEMGGVSREPGFLLWNFIGFQGGNVGGYVIFFPRNLSRQARPLSFCLEKIARESGGRLLPMLVPVNPLLPLRKALIHPDCRKIPGLREFLARMLPYVDRESAFPVNRLFLGEGVWAMRRFFSLDRPYEGWVVGRDPLARAPVMKNRRQVAWLVFLGAWGLILSPFLIRGTVPEISIRRTFPLFFFLVAAVPLAMRFSLESHQIEAGRFRQVAEMGDAALDEIRGVDGEFSEVISDFTQDSRALLSRPGWLARLASVDPGVECEAASEAFRIFSSSTIRLDLLLVYKPGKIPRGYSTDPELSRRDRTGLDFFAPAGQEIIRRCELDRPSGQIFPLSENQQKFARTVERRGIAPSGGLKGSTETGSIVRITGSWRYLTFSQTYSEKGRVKVFFILASKAEPVFSRFLRERVAGMSLASPKDRFLLGSFLPGNEEVILPPFGNSYWGTQAGRKMRQIMIRSSNFRAPILLERPDHLLVVRGCPNLGDFVVGREISLADLNGQVRWQWLVLIMGVLLLAGIALLLGQATIAFLIRADDRRRTGPAGVDPWPPTPAVGPAPPGRAGRGDPFLRFDGHRPRSAGKAGALRFRESRGVPRAGRRRRTGWGMFACSGGRSGLRSA